MTKSDRKCIVDEETTSSPGERATDWRSIYVASALSFVGAVQFSLYFSSLWPYLKIIDKSADEAFFGYIVAVYSLGQIISSPTFGWVSNKLKQVRLPMFVGLAMMLLGNMLYIALEFSGVAPRYLLLVGRFITGMGSGNVILLRTYASTASTYKDRHKAIAYVTCGQALGQTSGPAFQFLFTPLTYPGVQLFAGMSFNMYTAPAYFACAINIFGAMALYFLFRENYAGIVEENPTDCYKNNNGSKFSPGLPMYDIFAVLVCNVTRFTQMFVQTNLETLGTIFAMMMFAWPEATAVKWTSAAQGFVGALTLVTYLIYIFFKVDKFLNYRVASVVSLAALGLFHVLTFAWPFVPGNVVTYNSTLLDAGAEPVGCDADKFTWCDSLSPVNVWMYYVMYVVIIGLALPTMNITLTTLFSKILGPRRQGTQQGILQMSGSAARMLGPIAISTIYTAQGPRLAWGLEIVIISFSLVMWLVFYRRMVPLREMTPFVNAAYDSSVDSTESTPTKSFDKSPLANRASIVSDSIAQRSLSS